MDKIRKCFLKSLEKLHEPIQLPHREKMTLGRSSALKISDSSCSRKQISIQADVLNTSVCVIPLGGNPSGANGYRLEKDNVYTFHNKDIIELVLEKYPYEICFDPPPPVKEVANCSKTNGTTGQKRFHPIFEMASKKKPKLDEEGSSAKRQTGKWESVDLNRLLIFTSDNTASRSKIASYDLDGTIIETKSGKIFGESKDDWKFLFVEIKPKIKSLYEDGYKIVFFTNQLGIKLGKVKVEELQEKIENIIGGLGVPVQVFVAAADNKYRKPAIGMWEVLVEEKNDGIPINIDESFYCGDAAGRPKNWMPKRKKDHSVSDRAFAMNIKLPFFTPEEHFLGAKPATFVLPSFDPNSIDATLPLLEPTTSVIPASSKEVLLMVGYPASGKSRFCKEKLIPKGYSYVNRDMLKSWQKCVQNMVDALNDGKSVVVDNTNVDFESRKRFIEKAVELGAPIRCLVMNIGFYHALHNNRFRELTGEFHIPVGIAVMQRLKSSYIEPTLDEGFSEIIKINFKPEFADPKLKTLYYMFLLDK